MHSRKLLMMDGETIQNM